VLELVTLVPGGANLLHPTFRTPPEVICEYQGKEGSRMDEVAYQTTNLDHLGIVAEVCCEIGLAAWLDAQAPQSAPWVSIGTATVAMALNGLGFSNRRLYLVLQFFATKPLALLLSADVTADQLNDDCLGRTLDWIAAHDPTRLFAGLATQARRRGRGRRRGGRHRCWRR